MNSKKIVLMLAAACLSSFTMLFLGCEKREIPEGTLVSVYYSSDTRGKLEGCGCKHNGGGITKRAAKLKQARVENPHILYCDSGNFLTGTKQNDDADGMIAVKAYNLMGADVVNVCERELALGIDKFKAARAASEFDYVSANVKMNGNSITDAYVIKEANGARVAFVGLCGTKNMMRYDSTHVPDNVSIEDPIEAARKIIPGLHSNAEVIVILSSCGDHVDSTLAETFPGVNLIVGGRSFRANESAPWSVGDTRIVRASRDGKTIGKMDLVFGADRSIKTYSPNRVTMETSDPTDEAMLALVREYIPGFVDNPKDGVRIKTDAAAAGNN
jgi:2',3'-cyclic-nucleotide 2'-phosphodiesterase (5'-nucleotidase family)